MITIEEYRFTPDATACTVEFAANNEEQYVDVHIRFYDVLGDYIGCRKTQLGSERMHYFENNDIDGATAFVLERIGIQPL